MLLHRSQHTSNILHNLTH